MLLSQPCSSLGGLIVSQGGCGTFEAQKENGGGKGTQLEDILRQRVLQGVI